MFHVYSTLANPNRYAQYRPNSPNGVNIIEREITIKGGSGIAQKNIGTVFGIHTAVSDDDMEWLKDDFAFKQHVKSGYIRYEKQKINNEAAAADMITRDQKTDACPVVPEEYDDSDDFETIKPVLNTKKRKVA